MALKLLLAVRDSTRPMAGEEGPEGMLEERSPEIVLPGDTRGLGDPGFGRVTGTPKAAPLVPWASRRAFPAKLFSMGLLRAPDVAAPGVPWAREGLRTEG